MQDLIDWVKKTGLKTQSLSFLFLKQGETTGGFLKRGATRSDLH